MKSKAQKILVITVIYFCISVVISAETKVMFIADRGVGYGYSSDYAYGFGYGGSGVVGAGSSSEYGVDASMARFVSQRFAAAFASSGYKVFFDDYKHDELPLYDYIVYISYSPKKSRGVIQARIVNAENENLFFYCSELKSRGKLMKNIDFYAEDLLIDFKRVTRYGKSDITQPDDIYYDNQLNTENNMRQNSVLERKYRSFRNAAIVNTTLGISFTAIGLGLLIPDVVTHFGMMFMGVAYGTAFLCCALPGLILMIPFWIQAYHYHEQIALINGREEDKLFFAMQIKL